MNATHFISGVSLPQSDAAALPTREWLALVINQVVALLLWIALSPLLFIIMVSIWRTDGAPVLFGHYRVGKDGNLFKCWKFRSMRRDSARLLDELLRNDEAARLEWARDQKLTNDPRITAIGHFLRKTSLDELPQLLNVMRGEMSLVGPRPITVPELSRYGSARWQYVSVAPGMTGLWQISGRNNTTYAERVAFDRQYVESRSMLLDIGILLKTVRVVVRREGAR